MSSRHPYKVPKLLQWTFPKAVYRFNDTEDKSVILTFDDGPIPELTPWVMETLYDFRARGLFFCVGENIEKYPDIAQELLSGHHLIGNHTMHHKKAWKTKRSVYLNDIDVCQHLIETVPGYRGQAFFRPPYGQLTWPIYQNLKRRYSIILWSILSGDYNQKLDPKDILTNLKRLTQPGSIVVFHDNVKATKNLKYVLPRYLEWLREQGYSLNKL